MSEDNQEDLNKGITMNGDNNDEVASEPRNGDSDEEEIVKSSSESPDDLRKQAPPSPTPPCATVDMTGTIRSPIAAIAKMAKQPSWKNSGSAFASSKNKTNQDESLNIQRYRYSNSDDDDEWESDMDYSSINNVMSRELTIQQIHEQRAKLAAQNPTPAAATVVTKAPPTTHQLSGSSEKERTTSSSSLEPGAYSIDLSGRNIPISKDKDEDEDGDSVFDNEYASSTGLTSSESASSTMMDATTEIQDASAIMQLEAIPVDESLEQAKIQEMEEQMNREIQRRLSLERKISKERGGNRGHHMGIKERLPIIMALKIILAGIIVGLYFLLRPNDDTSVESPKETFFLYPPPTTEDCSFVLNGEAVPNQDQYSTIAMASTLDVSYNESVDSIEEVLSACLQSYKWNVIPTLVGCNEDGIRQEYFNLTFAANRYLVANAQVVNITRSNADCDPSAPLPCVRVAANYMFWLKAETSMIETITYLQTNFGPKLLQGLEEGGILQQQQLIALGPWQLEDEDKKPQKDDELHFPAPTAEECAAITNGEAVPNQDQYPTLVVDYKFDLSINDRWKDSIDEVLLEVRNKFENSLRPILTGCNSIGQEIHNRSPPEIQYLVANMRVMDVAKSSSRCYTSDDPAQPCVQVGISLFVWFKREVGVYDAFSAVHNYFQAELKASIVDSDIIQKVELVSVGPGPVQFEFPPPTKEECEAMTNGTPVPDRDRYFTERADSVIDVSIHEQWEDSLDTVLEAVWNEWQTFMIPSLSGCMDTIDETWFNVSKTPDRYVSVDSVVLNVTLVPGECNEAQPRPCVRVGIRSQMWLKKELDFFTIIKLIDVNYGPKLMAKIGDRDDPTAIIKQAEVVTMVPIFDDMPPNVNNNFDFDFEFPPPTEEECKAMMTGTSVPGQDDLFTLRADTVIDVSTHEPWEDSLAAVLLEVQITWQTVIIPSMGGCMDTVETVLNSTVTPDRYAWANSLVLGVSRVNGECNGGEPRPCVRVGIRTQIWLKKEMNFFDIISTLERNFGPTLMEKIGSRTDVNATIKQAEMVIMAPVF